MELFEWRNFPVSAHFFSLKLLWQVEIDNLAEYSWCFKKKFSRCVCAWGLKRWNRDCHLKLTSISNESIYGVQIFSEVIYHRACLEPFSAFRVDVSLLKHWSIRDDSDVCVQRREQKTNNSSQSWPNHYIIFLEHTMKLSAKI